MPLERSAFRCGVVFVSFDNHVNVRTFFELYLFPLFVFEFVFNANLAVEVFRVIHRDFGLFGRMGVAVNYLSNSAVLLDLGLVCHVAELQKGGKAGGQRGLYQLYRKSPMCAVFGLCSNNAAPGRMKPRPINPDRFVVLRAEAETIVDRLKTLREKSERKILLRELRNIIEKMESEAQSE
jgi:hypothetical protein